MKKDTHLQLEGLSAAAEGMFVDLVLDLLGGVGNIDSRVGQRATHLTAAALQRREELAVQQARLHEAQPRSHISVVLKQSSRGRNILSRTTI